MREFVLVSIAAVAAAYALSTDLIVDVDTEPRHRMDRLSSSFSIDSTSLFGYTRQGIDLTDSSLVQLAKNLAPAYIRIGGGIQDQVVYNTSGQIPAGGLPPRPAGIHLLYMNATVWDSLIDLCDRAGLRLVFGLNAKYGRQAKGDVPANEAPDWDPSNTRQLLEYVRSKGQAKTVHAWELGNESNVFNCSSEATNITGAQMAASFIKVRSIIDEITPDSELWGPDPSLTGDVRGQCRSYWGADVTRYFEEVLEGAGRVIDKVTWHYYSQFQGDNTSSADLVRTNEYQDRMRTLFLPNVTRAVTAFAPDKPVIIGETSSFWGGGLANVSNRFASGLWLLGELGEVGLAEGHRGMIRQDLVGGDYPLLDFVGGAAHPVVPLQYSPNPDYFTTALLQRVVGESAMARPQLRSSASGSDAAGQVRDYESEHVRAYAFSAKNTPLWGANSTALLLLNLRPTGPASLRFRCDGSVCGQQLVYWQLTPGDAKGLASALIKVNGETAVLGHDLSLPDLLGMGQQLPADGAVPLPASTYGIVVLDR